MFGGEKKKNNVQKEDYGSKVNKKTELIHNLKFGFKKLGNLAKIPTKKDGDAGYDLSVTYIEAVEKHNGRIKKLSTNSNGCFEVFPNIIYKAHTGIAANIPKSHYGLIKPRSGVSADFGLNTLAGIVDESYLGELIIIFTVEVPTEIKVGQRIAQIVVSPYFSEMGEISELKETDRGSKGFGSSGK